MLIQSCGTIIGCYECTIGAFGFTKTQKFCQGDTKSKVTNSVISGTVENDMGGKSAAHYKTYLSNALFTCK